MNWADYLEWGAREDGDKPLVYCDGAAVTYGEMSRWTNRIGNALADLGVVRGDRVATFLPNTPFHEAVLLGALKLGAIGCPLSLRERTPVVLDLLRTLEARVLVVGEEHAAFAEEVRASSPHLAVVVGEAPFEGGSDKLAVVPMRDHDVAFIAFTGGTTGRPKGVQVTARMLRGQNYAFYERFRLGRASEMFFGAVSFSHVGGLVVSMSLPFTTGASHVLLPKWDPAEALRLVEGHRVTCIIAATTLFEQMARTPEFTATDWSSLKVASVGGEAVSPELKARWRKVTDTDLREGFGMSEASVQVCVCSETTPPESCGTPYERIEEVRLVDPETRAVIVGAGKGELAVRGDNVTPGYWGAPEENGRKFDEQGWYYTRDMLRRDEQGYYYPVGRVDDMFQSGGENIFPAEIEAALLLHPNVTKAFCFPEPDPTWGQVPCAVVEIRPGTHADEQCLLEFCASHPMLPRYKRPRRLFCTDALPIGPTGKVVRRDLKEWLAMQGYHAGF